MSETIYPNHWEEPMTDINKPLDAHGTRIDLEAEFYCPTCEGFRDVRNHLNDIVCDECHTIIATHRDRVIHVPDSKPPAPPVVETEQEQPACTICGKGPFPTLRNWAYHDCKSLTPRTDAFHKAVNLYKDKNNLEGQICVGTPRDQFECVAFSRQLERSLTAAQLEIDRLKAELLWCVEVLESQRHEMDNEGNISTHVSEGKLEELQAIVANQRKVKS